MGKCRAHHAKSSRVSDVALNALASSRTLKRTSPFLVDRVLKFTIMPAILTSFMVYRECMTIITCIGCGRLEANWVEFHRRAEGHYIVPSSPCIDFRLWTTNENDAAHPSGVQVASLKYITTFWM